jgi:hypothetical protein
LVTAPVKSENDVMGCFFEFAGKIRRLMTSNRCLFSQSS